MLQLIDSAARGLAAATLLGALVLASPSHATTVDQPAAAPAQLAQTTPPAPPPAATKRPRRSPVDRVEQRIKTLHDALAITPAQEPQWNAVAQAMRDEAQAMQQAIGQREQSPTMNAVDDLKAYEAIADVHAQGLQKLVPAFQTLYASLSDDQKTKADALFSRARHPRSRSKKQ
ncbi:MAG: Spy/CpxP family protein refolding chaperone [Stellaceae bacterium]